MITTNFDDSINLAIDRIPFMPIRLFLFSLKWTTYLTIGLMIFIIIFVIPFLLSLMGGD